MVDTRGVVVDLQAVRNQRVPYQNNRARQVTVAFVAAATAEISRTELARALVLQGMRILTEDEGFAAAEHCALLVLVDLVRDPPNSA